MTGTNVNQSQKDALWPVPLTYTVLCLHTGTYHGCLLSPNMQLEESDADTYTQATDRIWEILWFN